MIIPLPEGYEFPLHVLLVYSLLYCHTVYIHLHTVNNIEVTINTCTCTDVLTVITTKDQSGGIYMYNNYGTGGQGFMDVLNKPRPQATPSDSVCLLP